MKDASPNDDDRQLDLTLRPTRIEEYIGQRQVKENLRIYMKAALRRREALLVADHNAYHLGVLVAMQRVLKAN